MTSANLKISPATSQDVPTLLSLIQALAEYEKLPASATAENLRETLFGPRPYAEVLIARLDNVAVGYALFFHTYSTFLAAPGLYLEDLFVLEEHRCKGVGKALLARVAKIARERNCPRLDWSVLAWNKLAIDFYRRLGAAIYEDWRICRLEGDSLAALADFA
jgi:GNAT superfamily N-acetyltransferase